MPYRKLSTHRNIFISMVWEKKNLDYYIFTEMAVLIYCIFFTILFIFQIRVPNHSQFDFITIP